MKREWNEEDFNAWKAKIDDMVQRGCGVSVDDLPDMPFADCFINGMSTSEFVQEYCSDETLMDLI